MAEDDRVWRGRFGKYIGINLASDRWAEHNTIELQSFFEAFEEPPPKTFPAFRLN